MESPLHVKWFLVFRSSAWLILMSFPALATAQDRTQARSMVITRRGIVATAQPLASQAGAQILARGGSAVDAAIAANAVLSLVEPMMNGPGGDLFALIWDSKTGKLAGINASGWAPKGLSIDYLKKHDISSLSSTQHPQRHGTGLRGRLGKTPQALRSSALEGSVRACHLLRRARISGHRTDPVGLGEFQFQAGGRRAPALHAEWPRAENRRDFSQSAVGARAAPDFANWARKRFTAARSARRFSRRRGSSAAP